MDVNGSPVDTFPNFFFPEINFVSWAILLQFQMMILEMESPAKGGKVSIMGD